MRQPATTNLSGVRQEILQRLAGGPCWARSFQSVKPVLEHMIAEGLVERCFPKNGRARNMVQLRQAHALSMLDHFAERLSQHGDIDRAAAQLGRSTWWGKQQFRALCVSLGPQAI